MTKIQKNAMTRRAHIIKKDEGGGTKKKRKKN